MLSPSFSGRVGLSLALGALLAVACSGAPDSEFYADPAQATSSDTDGGGASTTDEDGGTSSGNDSGSSNTGKDSGTNTADTGTTPVVRPDPGVFCGNDGTKNIYCPTGTEVCCVAQGDITTYECQRRGATACLTTTRVDCNDANDCEGTSVCCAIVDGDNISGVRCRSNCNGSGGVQLCDPNQKIECAGGRSCTGQRDSMPGYRFCQ